MVNREPVSDPIARLVDAVRSHALSELARTGREPSTEIRWSSAPGRHAPYEVAVIIGDHVAASVSRTEVHEAARACWIEFQKWSDKRKEGERL